MTETSASVDVTVPVRTAYNQWTQFEEFPRFMEGIQSVKQIDDRHLKFRAKIFGKEEAWTAEITEQEPDLRIAWKSTEGAHNAGVVTFHRLNDHESRVHLQMQYEPAGIAESVGDALGFLKRRVEGDLKRFKEFIESEGDETGAWRGEIEARKEP